MCGFDLGFCWTFPLALTFRAVSGGDRTSSTNLETVAVVMGFTTFFTFLLFYNLFFFL